MAHAWGALSPLDETDVSLSASQVQSSQVQSSQVQSSQVQSSQVKSRGVKSRQVESPDEGYRVQDGGVYLLSCPATSAAVGATPPAWMCCVRVETVNGGYPQAGMAMAADAAGVGKSLDEASDGGKPLDEAG